MLRSRRAEGAVALAVYLAAAVGLIGRSALAHPRTGTVGIGPDVQIFLWAFRWWPYALAHGVNPVSSGRVWPPHGGAVLWSSTVPLLGLLAAPLTLTLGPLAVWNLLIVLAPATAAWGAWLLCAELGAGAPAAFAGGALFGFGSYDLAENIAHPQLSVCLLVPLLARVAVRGVCRGTPARRLALATGVILLAQFLIDPEIAATMLIMSAVGLLSALAVLPADRGEIVRTSRAMVLGALAGGVILSPLLAVMLSDRPAASSGAVGWPIDLLNLLVPTRLTTVGGAAAASLSTRFPGDLAEQGGYLGVPLLLLILTWAWRARREPAGRLLSGLLVVSVILSLGSRLTVDGTRVVWLPWALVAHLGLLRDVLPARLSMYTWLLAAVILARRLSEPRGGHGARGVTVRVLVLTLVAASLLPAGRTFQTEPGAARSAAVRRELRGRRVISLPFFDVHDRGLEVQEADDMDFSLTDGWLQVRPDGYALHGVSLTARALARTHGASAARLLAELRADGITRVLLWERTPRLLDGLHLRSHRVAGVVIARVP